MRDIKGFLKVKRETAKYRPICERVNDFKEVAVVPTIVHTKDQATRCMDCGTPFCHWACPVGNYIPEWNDLVSRGHWEKAYNLLAITNNLPEVTGRICPALCEYSCVLGFNDDPVTIRENELSVIENAFRSGLIKPNKPKKRTGKKIAVIGSGPAGITCADQLNKAGHKVVVFEKDDKMGGILRFGIPDFKLEKWILDRRLELLKKEGVIFRNNINVGVNYSARKLRGEFDAICLAGGCRIPRDLNIEGRDLEGVCFAMDYLVNANKTIERNAIKSYQKINAYGKKVLVIGGGDTGADCIGVAHRQKASCVTQIEIMPRPAESRSKDFPWPRYPLILKVSTSHEEGGIREWSIITKKFIGEAGAVKKVLCARASFQKDENNCPVIKEIPGSEFFIEADLVILALGFVSPDKKGMLEELGVQLDNRGNVKTDSCYMTSIKGVFCAGDMHRGQSLIVWAISEARQAAYYIDSYLMGNSCLPKM